MTLILNRLSNSYYDKAIYVAEKQVGLTWAGQKDPAPEDLQQLIKVDPSPYGELTSRALALTSLPLSLLEAIRGIICGLGTTIFFIYTAGNKQEKKLVEELKNPNEDSVDALVAEMAPRDLERTNLWKNNQQFLQFQAGQLISKIFRAVVTFINPRAEFFSTEQCENKTKLLAERFRGNLRNFIKENLERSDYRFVRRHVPRLIYLLAIPIFAILRTVDFAIGLITLPITLISCGTFSALNRVTYDGLQVLSLLYDIAECLANVVNPVSRRFPAEVVSSPTKPTQPTVTRTLSSTNRQLFKVN